MFCCILFMMCIVVDTIVCMVTFCSQVYFAELYYLLYYVGCIVYTVVLYSHTK